MSSEEEQVHMPNSWLDYAMVQYGGTYSESDVLEVRALSKVTLMFAMFIPYWVIYAQVKVFLIFVYTGSCLSE